MVITTFILTIANNKDTLSGIAARYPHIILHAHMDTHAYTYVTIFWKTDHLDTRTEIHLLPVCDRHTHALSRTTKH